MSTLDYGSVSEPTTYTICTPAMGNFQLCSMQNGWFSSTWLMLGPHVIKPSWTGSIVFAELLDLEQDPTGELAGIVRSVMTHGPCGVHNPTAPCMVNGTGAGSATCSKQYPRPFTDETVMNADNISYTGDVKIDGRLPDLMPVQQDRKAIWQLFEYAMHEEQPLVINLSIHLPGQQIVYFDLDLSAAEVQDKMDRTFTTLMAFFDYNCNNTDGRNFLY
ncbi:MAG: hypothetical protein FRX48_09024 [Lasallia pustulata]|uniref:Uncharacterized protein n=1 Tax=Lasallia pustulata TaxID=136370 RepID=A0A5M8PET9_9LECA|nr:MAG: hypothetical protein FRX48_09024 [Lasallia pustulata]